VNYKHSLNNIVRRPIENKAYKKQHRDEEQQKKIEKWLSSPEFQERLKKALSTINQKLLRQRRFLKVLDTPALRRS